LFLKKQYTHSLLHTFRISCPPRCTIVGERSLKGSVEVGRHGGHLCLCEDTTQMQKSSLVKEVGDLIAIIVTFERSTEIQITAVSIGHCDGAGFVNRAAIE
jgi:hypothetical protein